jgi:hypothetical protein
MRRVLPTLVCLLSACAVAPDDVPGDRLGRGDDPQAPSPTPGPCASQEPVAAQNQPVGRTDTQGALVRDRLQPTTAARDDELVIETKNLAVAQSGWSFNIPLVGYNQYSVCKVCVYLALDGGQRLMASDGWVRNLAYEPDQRLAGQLDGVVFQEINGVGEFVPNGCRLALSPATYNFDVPTPLLATQ